MKKVATMIGAGLLGGLITVGLLSLFQPEEKRSNEPVRRNQFPSRHVNMAADNVVQNTNFTQAAEKTIHAVVHVKTSVKVQQQQYSYDPFRHFFNEIEPKQKEIQRGSGSGVIVSKDGYIVTNNHVIDQASKIEVTLDDKRTYTAKLIGADPSTDLALLKIEENDLDFVTYGNSDSVKIGQWVLAVGNPFNLTSTVTAGIVSAKARNINIMRSNPSKGVNPIESFIQTDAAVNPGNSGGALVNQHGQLIGINTAIASNTGSYTGYSFAIPVNIAGKVVADLLEFGEVQRAFIGVSIRDITAELAKEKDLEALKGVYVSDLMQGGSASDAGIKPGDVITAVEDVDVNTVAALQEIISTYRPGEKVKVDVVRDGVKKTFDVELRNKNGNVALVKKEVSSTIAALGVELKPITEADKKKLRIENGLKVTKLSAGKLLSVGVKPGFIITHLDKEEVLTIEDVQNALSNVKGGVLLEGIYPDGSRAYYGFGL